MIRLLLNLGPCLLVCSSLSGCLKTSTQSESNTTSDERRINDMHMVEMDQDGLDQVEVNQDLVINAQ